MSTWDERNVKRDMLCGKSDCVLQRTGSEHSVKAHGDGTHDRNQTRLNLYAHGFFGPLALIIQRGALVPTSWWLGDESFVIPIQRRPLFQIDTRLVPLDWSSGRSSASHTHWCHYYTGAQCYFLESSTNSGAFSKLHHGRRILGSVYVVWCVRCSIRWQRPRSVRRNNRCASTKRSLR